MANGDLIAVAGIVVAAWFLLSDDTAAPAGASGPIVSEHTQAPVGHPDQSGEVARARDDLGNPGGPCGAKAICQLAAQRMGGGAGLLYKPSGNNCDERATDIIAYQDGAIYDVLVDAGGANTPSWQRDDPIDPNRWRQP